MITKPGYLAGNEQVESSLEASTLSWTGIINRREQFKPEANSAHVWLVVSSITYNLYGQ
jgi:hypothetical protein